MQLGRVDRLETGDFQLRYTAIDPADKYVRCNCKKLDCWTRDLHPLREHINRLFHAILDCGMKGLIDGGINPWPGTLYSLQMASSIDDIFVDPSYSDGTDSAIWCRTSWEFDEEQREKASKYVAALTIFNFTWIAYESAIESALGNANLKPKPPVHAREFFKSHQESGHHDIPHLAPSLIVASRICSRIDEIKTEIHAIKEKYALEGCAAAAELARIFRNHVVHGKDKTPLSSETFKVSHFYSVTRLLLMLTQALVSHKLIDKDYYISVSIEEEDPLDCRAEYLIKNLHRRGMIKDVGEHFRANR